MKAQPGRKSMKFNLLNTWSLRVLLNRTSVDNYLQSNGKSNNNLLIENDDISKTMSNTIQKQTTLLDFFKLQNNKKNIVSLPSKDYSDQSICQSKSSSKNEIQDVSNNEFKKIYENYRVIKRCKPKNQQICRRCDRKFESKSFFKKHKRICGILFYECKLCSEKYEEWNLLKNHFKNRHIDEMEREKLTEIMKTAWEKGNELKVAVHELNHVEKSTPKIKFRRTNLEENLKLRYYQNIEFYCLECDVSHDRSIETKEDLDDCSRCRGKFNPKCRKCGKLFITFKSAYDHVKYICNPLQYLKCSYCDYVCTRKRSFRKHNNKYHPDMVRQKISTLRKKDLPKKLPKECNYHCNNCVFKCLKKNDLTLHILNSHGSDYNLMHCDKCGQIFKKLRSFKHHKMICGLKNYKCKYCQFRWLEPNGFIKIHLKMIHDREMKNDNVSPDDVYHEIQKENRRFKAKSLELFHNEKRNNIEINDGPSIKTEDKVKQYCEKCNVTSEVIRINLIWIVANCQKCGKLLKFKCPHCNKLFSSLKSAKIHVKHTCSSRKIFKSMNCGYENSREKLLIDHIDKYDTKIYDRQNNNFNDFSLKRVYYCDNCNYKSFRKYKIRRHILNEHPIHSEFQHYSKYSKLYKNSLALEKHEHEFRSKKLTNTPELIEPYLLTFQSKEFQHNELNSIHDDILKETGELNAKTIKSLPAKLENPGMDNSVVCSFDEKIKAYCLSCQKISDNIRGKRNTIIKNCQLCGSTLQFECLKCKKTYTKYTSLLSHIRHRCFPRYFYKCLNCNFLTTWKPILCNHLKSNHNQSPPENFDGLLVDGKDANIRKMFELQQDYKFR